MGAEEFSQFNHVLLKKALNICLKCCDSVFNLLFYLPCGGETSFRRRCVKFAALKAGDWILDVCCGAGELTTVIARQGFTGQVVGVDISESALEIARTKTQHTPVTFLRASASDLPLDSSRFDRCFISFGLHHMSEQERQKTLTEIHRILARQGTLYIIEYNLPEKGPRRLAAIAFAKLDKSEEAYEMLKNGSPIREIKQGGFEMERRGLTCQGIIQLLQVVKK
ncbi:MAG: class I SAM-dependent methyltransferase [Chloroflexota bacterium]|nr:class I SAM-dependent methyltransferase [Chloroflexota bacterium]